MEYFEFEIMPSRRSDGLWLAYFARADRSPMTICGTTLAQWATTVHRTQTAAINEAKDVLSKMRSNEPRVGDARQV